MADYRFYREEYGGELLDEAAFAALAPRAQSYVDNITLGRSRRAPGEAEAIGRAVCRVAEVLRLARGGEIESETVGQHTVRYRGGPAAGGELYAAAQLYLGGTGLLYRGF